MFKKTLLGAIVAAGSLTALLPTAANAQYSAIVSVAPPPPVHEVVPAPRRGYVWAPGHHEWRHDRYVWVQGHWLQARNGYDYREPRWVQRGNGQWVLVGNNWERRGPYGDRDRDGIPNRFDHDNRRMGAYGDRDRDGIPNRFDRDNRMGPNGDRDGDGVRNRDDRFPDNPRRN